ncbi:MAG: DNA polymerase III subunit chi [Thermoanaerobaculum sp.]|nr:DNA polymerase III subunit chi [Thermoanaerobaculum sp.]MCX7896071.1 DNA polymerase III subunit chi [Thermoanaerobaculum sp.]MDW7967991.1 DNA polymerase III subunit chi [Thermoanaerobaculum sp.]
MEQARVLLYRLAGSKKALDACRLVERLYLKGHRVVVWLQDQGRAVIFDQYLWTFSDTSFVPHRLAMDQKAVEEPVAIVAGELYNPNGADHLVVLEAPKNLKQVHDFAVVHDLLVAGEERRERWEAAGFAVEEARHP